MVHLDYRDSRPIYAQIVDGFREQITGGVLRPGEKLPSVRDLAAQLAINPNTIQRAYRRLEAEGWIATVPGKGCFVCGDGEIREREKKRLLRRKNTPRQRHGRTNWRTTGSTGWSPGCTPPRCWIR